MQFLQGSPKTKASRRHTFLLIASFSVFIIYTFLLLLLLPKAKLLHDLAASQDDLSTMTTLEDIVFGIASNEKSWLHRKNYVKLWWRPRIMRGCVFLESMRMLPNTTSYNDTASLPPVCISQDTSGFPYTFRGRDGLRFAVRLARVVSETVALNHSNVKWFVFGDDDTYFFPENLEKTLSKYDHSLWYYIGTNSESFWMIKHFSFDMAFGGGGFAISYPLAKVLAKVLDSCLERYPHLYGSDSRIYACIAELGVGLTHEPGFHQMDVRGNSFGFLAVHPVRPLVSLHHMDFYDPIFPNRTPLQAMEHLLEAASIDPQRVLQQTVCYDRQFSWTISVPWGYAVQVFRNHVFLPEAIRVPETYIPWRKDRKIILYNFDTREHHQHPCQRPVVFFMDNISSGRNGIQSVYKIMTSENCTFNYASPRRLEQIKVLSNKLDLDMKQLKAPRRHCCEVLPSSTRRVMEIGIRECEEEELIRIR